MSSGRRLEADFRESLASEDYTRAGRIWAEYRKWLEPELLCAGGGEALRHARELIDWAARTIVVSRALAMGELNSLEIRGRYQASGTQRAGIEVRG